MDIRCDSWLLRTIVFAVGQLGELPPESRWCVRVSLFIMLCVFVVSSSFCSSQTVTQCVGVLHAHSYLDVHGSFVLVLHHLEQKRKKT